MRAGWLLLAVCLTACGGGTVRRTEEASARGEGRGSPDYLRPGNDPLAARMRDLAGQLAPAGARPSELDGRGFLAARATETTAIEVPARTCVSIVAITSAGLRDLDATLFDPSGDVLAEDVEPDAHPTIQVCAGNAPRRAYYGLLAYEGAGAYYWSAFVSERAAFDAVSRVIGGRPGVASDTPAETEQDIRVRDFASGVVRRGFRAEGDPSRVPLAADQRVRVPLEMRASTCTTVAGFTLEGLADVDLRILDEEGQEVARDVSPAADPAAQICVDRDALWSVELHAVRGAGEVRLAVYRAPVSTIGGASGLWLGQRAEVRVAQVPLDEAIARDVRGARDAGWGAPAQRGRGVLVPGEAVSHRIDLAAGRCTLVMATGGGGVGRLHLRIVDDAGAVLTERNARRPTADARICTGGRARATAQIVARLGGGEYALHTFTRARPPSVPASAAAAESGALLDAIDEAAAAGYSPHEPATAFEPMALVAERPAERAIPLAPSACVRVNVVAEGPGAVDAELRRGGRSLARATGRVAELRACGGEGLGPTTLEVRGSGGTARAWVGVFERLTAAAGAP